jgi:general secretion pathway protein D
MRLLALLVFFGLITAHGAETTSAPMGMIGPLILREESLDQVLVTVERWSGRTLLRPQTLPNVTISLNLDHAVPKAEALRALETVLQLNGIALSPLGDSFLKVTPLAQVKFEAPELIEGSTLALPASGRIASKIFYLKFLQVSELVPQISGLLNTQSGGPPLIFDKANAALITDSLSNLQRVETLVSQLDQPSLAGVEPAFFTLRHAKASDVVLKMKTILAGSLQNKLGSATSLNADDRTNQIVLVTDARQLGFFSSLINKLDVRSEPNTRNDVIQLKFAAAKDVASALSQLVSTQNRGNGAQVHLPIQPSPAPVQPSQINPAATKGPTLELDSPVQFSSFLTILPEERSNAIIVSGTVDDFRLINELVAKIDVLLAQVRIEVVIAEVTLSNNSASGISELGLRIEGDKLTGFTASLPGLSASDGEVIRPDGINTVTGPWDLAAQITLASTPRKSNANILSVPTIITTHNREGRIFVGEQRPVISSYLADATSTGTGSSGYRSTVASKDIGIQLSVKPLIGADGSVQLEIKQEVNDVLGEITIDGNSQPRIGRRSTESFVSARSGEVIVLGGLQRNSLTSNSNRLGPIPIIGDLLGARSKEKTRTDLVFFLRPTVLTQTAADNLPALEQVEQFPKNQREDVKKSLGLSKVP